MIDDDRLLSHVSRLVDDCESYLEEQSRQRERALEYYQGEMKDLKAEEGRSSVVSNDIRAVIKKVMPSVMRAILSNDKIVEYEPVGQEDVETAEQASDYINHVVVPACGAERAIHDAVFDALLVKTGILKWVAYEKRKVVIQDYSNISNDDFLGLLDDPDYEVFDHEELEETDQDILALDPNARRHSFKLRQLDTNIDIRLEAVPRGSFLIHPQADSIEDAPIVGERLEVTRSDLVEMGYDREAVYSLAAHSQRSDRDDEDDDARRGDDWTDTEGDVSKALETVLIYEVYVKLDQDDDGIAEMYRIVYGESGDERYEGEAGYVGLDMEPVSEAPYASVIAERDAHQFEGHSLFEDVEHYQRIKTALMRGTLDSVYGQNNPRSAVDLSMVQPESHNAVYSGRIGEPIALKAGADASRVLQWLQQPFIGNHTYQMLGTFDEIIKDLTGITDASGGVDPEAFQNMTATSAQLMSESGIAQAEMIIRNLTRGGIRKAFRGLLKLVIAHQDRERTVRIRGDWVNYNPALWNVDMDCTVNVGLGAGTRERDMSVLQVILQLQEKIAANMGPDNPFVKPDQLYNTLQRITETAGFPSADPYFTKPNPEEIQAKLQAEQQKPDPQAEKVQAQIQLEQAKAQASQAKEQAQMQADLQVKEAERQTQLEMALYKAQLELTMHKDKMALEAAKAGLPPITSGQILPEMPEIANVG